MSESRVEIICLVEGEDSIMSTCVRGSTRTGAAADALDDFAQSDIAWDAAFAPCVTGFRTEAVKGLLRLARSGGCAGRAPAASGVAHELRHWGCALIDWPHHYYA